MVEMKFIAGLIALGPDISYVLISTDSIDLRNYAAKFVKDVGLENEESWLFVNSFSERLGLVLIRTGIGNYLAAIFLIKIRGMKAHSDTVSDELLQE